MLGSGFMNRWKKARNVIRGNILIGNGKGDMILDNDDWSELVECTVG